MSLLFTPFKVGLLVLVSVLSFIFFYTSIKKGISDGESSYTVYALFDNATGLTERSKVQIAGINVGEIKKISLDHKAVKAKVIIKIKGEITLKTDATVSKKSSSILGDNFLELTPGIHGNPLTEGMQLTLIIENAGVSSMMNQFGAIAKDIKEMTGSLKTLIADKGTMNAMKGTIQKLEKISEKLDSILGQNNKKIGDILSNVNQITQDFRKLTPQYNNHLSKILKEVEQITRSTRMVVDENRKHVNSIMLSTKSILKSAEEKMPTIEQTIDHARDTTRNVAAISGQVKSGEGTVGKIIYSDELYNNANETIKNINKTVENTNKVVKNASGFVNDVVDLQIKVDLHSEYLIRNKGGSHSFGLILAPDADKYYYGGLTDSPYDVLKSHQRTVTDTNGVESIEEEKVYEDTFAYTIFMAYRFKFITLKYGIFDSDAGVGADLSFLNDKLTLLTRLNEFDLDMPNLKIGARYNFWSNLFLNVGAIHTISNDRRDFYLGLGAHFTENDLKTIFTVAPSVSMQ